MYLIMQHFKALIKMKSTNVTVLTRRESTRYFTSNFILQKFFLEISYVHTFNLKIFNTKILHSNFISFHNCITHFKCCVILFRSIWLTPLVKWLLTNFSIHRNFKETRLFQLMMFLRASLNWLKYLDRKINSSIKSTFITCKC